MKRFALISSIALPLILVGALLVFWDLSAKVIRVQYKMPVIDFETPRLVDPEYFTDFLIELGPLMTPLPEQEEITFYWQGKSYPLPALTSATLTSLGFSLVKDRNFAGIYIYSLRDSGHYIELRMAGDIASRFRGYCEVSKPHTCPYAISYDGKPILAFPATRLNLERSFGNSYDTSSKGMHPILAKLAHLLP